MRLPVRCLVDHCSWDYAGSVWATWEINPPTYGRLPARETVAWLWSSVAALVALPEEVMISGVCRPVTAESVAERMRRGVDMTANPEWEEVVSEAGRRLDLTDMYERRIYLTAQLPRGRSSRTALARGSAVARVGRQFRLLPVPVKASEVDDALRQADQLTMMLAGFLGSNRVAPVRNGTLKWLYARAGTRGTAAEPKEERFADSTPRVTKGEGRVVRTPTLCTLRPPVLFEGGSDEDADRPRHRKYLRLETERTTTYQTCFALADMPGEWTVPGGGGEILARVDGVRSPVDWSLRLRRTANSDAQRQIGGKVAKLAGQYQEYQGRLEGAPESIDRAIGELKEMMRELQDSPGSPEYQTSLILAHGADDLVTLEEHAARLRDVLGADEYGLERPTGDQRHLWGAMLPGSPCPPALHDYTEFLPPRSVAGCAPFAGSGLGDPQGGLLGHNLDAHLGGPVLFAPSYGPAMPSAEGGPRSGSVGFVGQLGAGKSQTAKLLVDEALRQNCQVVITDRTNMEGVGEYGRYIPVMPRGKRHQVIRPGQDGIVLDLIRMFTGNDADRFATGFLTILTGTPPRSARGTLLQEAVSQTRAAGGGMADIPDWLEFHDHDEADRSDARELHRLISACIRTNAMASVAFGRGAPVALDADLILFHAPELTLPNESELTRPDELLPDQILSVALLYLINCVARHVAFRDRSRFTLVVVDEGYALKASPQGRDLLTDLAKNGRKENAGLLYITHLPSEIPREVSDSIDCRFVFRMARENASEGLEWIGMEPTQANVSLIVDGRRSGECLFRDRYGRHGLVQVRQPHTQALREAFETSVGRVPTTVPFIPPPPALATNGNGHNGNGRRRARVSR